MDTGKKLLLISFSSVPSPDRHSASVTGTVRALSRLFESIDIVAIKGEFLAHIERYHGSRLLRVPLVGESVRDRAESFRRAVRRQIESDSYDVIHVRSPLEGVPICEGRDEKGYKIVYEAGSFAVQDSLDSEQPGEDLEALEAQMRRDEVSCASQADLVIVHSESARQTLRNRGVSSPMDMIPGGVNIDAFDWEVTADPPLPTIVCLGRIAPWRDVSGVMEAIHRVQEVMPVRLRWIGEPDAKRRETFTTYAAELGVEGAITFEATPENDELPLLISGATMCLAPVAPVDRYVEWGDQPTGLLEYMACRRPVIAARAPGVEEVVRDGTEALLYTPGDPAGITSAILFLLRNPRHRQLLAKRGYRRVREQFCESAQRRRMLEVYHELLGLDRQQASQGVDTLTDAESSAVLDAIGVDTAEPITAVMEVADESRRVKVDGDTRRVKSANPEEHEEHYDTQPNIEVKSAAPELTDDESDSAAWNIPETTPHMKRPSAVVDTPEPDEAPPVTVEVEDTSRIVSRDTTDSQDLELDD